MTCFTALHSHPILFALGAAFILLSAYGIAAVFCCRKNIVITTVVKIERAPSGAYLAEFDCGRTLRAAEYQILELQTNPYGVLVHDRKQILFFYAEHSQVQAAERLAREQKRARRCRLLSLLCAMLFPALGSVLVLALLSAGAVSLLYRFGVLVFLLLPTVCCFAHFCVLKAANVFREHTEVTLSHLILLTALLLCQSFIALCRLQMPDHMFGLCCILTLCLPIGVSLHVVHRKI